MKKRYKSLKEIKQILEQLIGKPVNCYYDLERGFTMVRYDTDVDIHKYDDEAFLKISEYDFKHFQEHRHPFLVIPNCKAKG